MIEATFAKNNDRYTRFKIQGHANYDEYGKDVVCAAVSALVINCINSISAFTDDKPTLKCYSKGHIEIEFTHEITNMANAFVASLELGIEAIRDQYGSKYIAMK